MAGSSSASLANSTLENMRISALDATSNSVGLTSFSGQVLRSSVATSPGAAMAATLSSQIEMRKAIRNGMSP
ncbi:hypothetical protein D3C84_1143920 [compost metagenome]